MKLGKAAGPSGVVIEMTRTAVDTGDLFIAIIRGGKVPADWEQSFIVCLFKGNGDMLWTGATIEDCKLKEQAMKAFKWIAYNLIRQAVTIDESQFGFVPGRGTTDAIFVLRQLQEKYFTVGKQIYMAIVDSEKTFDRVPQNVTW